MDILELRNAIGEALEQQGVEIMDAGCMVDESMAELQVLAGTKYSITITPIKEG